MNRILFWLSGFLPWRVISDGKRPYLDRFYICTFLGVRYYLHRFTGSDPGRGKHNHPWLWALSFVLWRRYFEDRRSGTRTIRWFNFLIGDTFHRINLPPGITEVWTLFCHHAKDSQPWGYLNEDAAGNIVFKEHIYPIHYDKAWWKSAASRRQIERSKK